MTDTKKWHGVERRKGERRKNATCKQCACYRHGIDADVSGRDRHRTDRRPNSNRRAAPEAATATKTTLEIPSDAVISRAANAPRPSLDSAWAKRLAADSVKAGESESTPAVAPQAALHDKTVLHNGIPCCPMCAKPIFEITDAPAVAPAAVGAREWPECEEFYDRCQSYRHAPLTDPVGVIREYNELKAWLRIERDAYAAAQTARAEAAERRVGDIESIQHAEKKILLQEIEAHAATKAKLLTAERAIADLSKEYHAVINEPEYAGTRQNWIDRCMAAERRAEALYTLLQEAKWWGTDEQRRKVNKTLDTLLVKKESAMPNDKLLTPEEIAAKHFPNLFTAHGNNRNQTKCVAAIREAVQQQKRKDADRVRGLRRFYGYAAHFIDVCVAAIERSED